MAAAGGTGGHKHRVTQPQLRVLMLLGLLYHLPAVPAATDGRDGEGGGDTQTGDRASGRRALQQESSCDSECEYELAAIGTEEEYYSLETICAGNAGGGEWCMLCSPCASDAVLAPALISGTAAAARNHDETLENGEPCAVEFEEDCWSYFCDDPDTLQCADRVTWDGVTFVTRISVTPAYCEDVGCDYACSAEYSVSVDGDGDTLTLAPQSTTIGVCECYSATLYITGSNVAGTFPDGTSVDGRLNSDNTVTVTYGGQCIGRYTTVRYARSTDDTDDAGANLEHRMLIILAMIAVAAIVAPMVCWGCGMWHRKYRCNARAESVQRETGQRYLERSVLNDPAAAGMNDQVVSLGIPVAVRPSERERFTVLPFMEAPRPVADFFPGYIPKTLEPGPGQDSDGAELSAELEALEQEETQREFPADVDGPLQPHEWVLRPNQEPEPEAEPEPAAD